MLVRSLLAALLLAPLVAPGTAALEAVAFSTFLGSLGNESAADVAIDGEGFVYLVGQTDSTSFPVVAAAQPSNAGGVDLFVAKLTPDGRSIVYATYLGGAAEDIGTSIAVDGSGAAYVTGRTNSLNFPTTPNAYDATNGRFPVCAGGDCIDSFVAKLAPDGGLLFSTYLGGEHDDYGEAIAVDAAGNTYITGSTNSFGFPRVNAFEPDKKQGSEAFVTKLNATGTDVVYSSYIGGNRGDGGFGVAVGADGSAVFVGDTFSFDFLTRDPLQAANAGAPDPLDALDAFVARVDASGALVFSTYLGGPGRDLARAVAIGPEGTIAIGGETLSPGFPTLGAAQAALAGDDDGFLAVVAGDGAALVASTYLGGSGEDGVASVAATADGRFVLAGSTRSIDFPTVAPLQAACASCIAPGFFADAFVTVYDPAAARFDFSTFLGGTAAEEGAGVAVAADGAVVIAGRTFSTNFPTTPDVVQPSCVCEPGSSQSAFVARFEMAAVVTPPSISRVERLKQPFRLQITGTGFQPGASVFIGGDTTPWPAVVVSSATAISVGGGRNLKARLPRRVAVELRVVNPDGGEATVTFTR